MSHGKTILTALNKSFREKQFESGDSIVRVGKNGNYVAQWKAGDLHVKAELVEEDSIGVLVNYLIVEKDRVEDRDAASYLRTVGESIEKRVSYLMEPLKIIELDSTNNVVQMRSEKPEFKDGILSYYELLLKSGRWFGQRDHIVLRRYAHRPEEEKRRRQVAFPLTKHQLERLLDDLLDIL